MQTSVPIPESRRAEVKAAVDNACDALSADGVAPRDYVEQIAWLFFVKALDDAEHRRGAEALAFGTAPASVVPARLRWRAWAKGALKDDALFAFLTTTLWPWLTGAGPDGRALDDTPPEAVRRIRALFSAIDNGFKKPSTFARVVRQIDRLDFNAQADVAILSEIYESLLKRAAADSAGYAGEFHTQRHIIQMMVEVVRPRLGERIYDPCFGTAGFLTAAADYLRAHTEALSGDDLDTLHQRTFFGYELRPFAFLLGSMNLMLHDIERPVIDIANTLERHSNTVPEKDRYDVILTNPPYGGNRVADEVKGNFTHRGSAPETLFLQHIMKSLARGGRAAVIVPEGVLFRGSSDLAVRRELVAQFDLHTVLSLPAGCFLPYTGVKTNVLFFDRRRDGRGTESVWYYDLTNDGFELKGTRKPIEGNQIPDFLAKQRTHETSERSWSVAVTAELVAKGCDLSARNPAQQTEDAHIPARELVARIRNREERIVALLDELDEMLGAAE